MSITTNVVIIGGHLTRDIELKYLQNGTAVADIGLCINEKRKKDGEWIHVPTFVDVTAWARTAETVAEHKQKGDAVLITGRLTLDSWEKDGEKRQKLRVTAENIDFLFVNKRDREVAEDYEDSLAY